MTATAPARPSTARPTTIEPGGIESIPADKRHGSPWQLLATWSAPNLEFATVFVGFIGVAFFGLGFWQAVAAIVIGNALGSATQGILSTWGPREGLAQLVLSRTAFGLRGNILPSAEEQRVQADEDERRQQREEDRGPVAEEQAQVAPRDPERVHGSARFCVSARKTSSIVPCRNSKSCRASPSASMTARACSADATGTRQTSSS